MLVNTLFHYIVRKLKHCVSLEAINYFAPISVFQILVRIFKNTQFHLSRSSSFDKHFSYFVLKHIMAAKKLGFTGIQRILFSDQWFLDFGEDAHEYLISLITTQFCLEKLLIICLTTYSGSEITLFHWEPSNILLRSVCSGFWWGFQQYFIHLTRRSFVCKIFLDFVLPHVMEVKKLCFNWIQVLFCSDQCFLVLERIFVNTWFDLFGRSSLHTSCSYFILPHT